MTCIAAVKHQGSVYIGGDSGLFTGWGVMNVAHSKVSQRGEFLIGCSGDVRACQLVAYSFMPPTPPDNTALEAFMATEFVAALHKCLKAGGAAMSVSGQDSQEANFLVGVRGRLFEVGSSYGCVEFRAPYAAIGAGKDLALAALCVLIDMEPRMRILTALAAAETHSALVRGPFNVEAIGPGAIVGRNRGDNPKPAAEGHSSFYQPADSGLRVTKGPDRYYERYE